jgi:hypothetical protein
MNTPKIDKGLTKSKLQERLVELYLRLNGYFLSKFIVHSPLRGRNKAEVDVLAVRFPRSAEPERAIQPDVALQVSDANVDLLVCEVKSIGQQLQFNKSLLDSPSSLEPVLRWSGMFEADEVPGLAIEFRGKLLNLDRSTALIPQVVGPRNNQIRGVLACPERNKRARGQPWFLDGDTILTYVERCLRPAQLRSRCATTYDFTAWDRYEDIVRCIKDRHRDPPRTFKDLLGRLARATRAHGDKST